MANVTLMHFRRFKVELPIECDIELITSSNLFKIGNKRLNSSRAVIISLSLVDYCLKCIYKKLKISEVNKQRCAKHRIKILAIRI